MNLKIRTVRRSKNKRQEKYKLGTVYLHGSWIGKKVFVLDAMEFREYRKHLKEGYNKMKRNFICHNAQLITLRDKIINMIGKEI